MSTPEQLLDLIARRAKALREVGVVSVQLEGVSFALLPYAPELDVEDAKKRGDDVPDPDPLEDPRTYGRMTGTPGFQRPKKEQR